jgi:hypothetical protein
MSTLEKLREVAANAGAALSEENDCQAAKKWRDLLGSNDGGFVFPLPEHCNEDGSMKSSAITPGSKVVPSGEGKFA